MLKVTRSVLRSKPFCSSSYQYKWMMSAFSGSNIDTNSVQSENPAAQEDASDGFDDEIDILFSKKNEPSSSEESARVLSRQRMSPFGRPVEKGMDEHGSRSRIEAGQRQSLVEHPFRKTADQMHKKEIRTNLPVRIVSGRDDNQDIPRHHPAQEPYEGGFVSMDESPYRIRELFQVKELWRETLIHPKKTYDDLIQFMKPLSLWQSLHAYLMGGKALQEIQTSKRSRARYEQEIRDIRDAVVSGDFMWRGKSGIYIQGEMRKGLEPKMYRADVKEMEELVEKRKRRANPVGIEEDVKSMLESFFQDRLVIEVMRVVLEAVYETSFSDFSHGFRPGRTQHTALKQVRRDFSDSMWIFRSDLRGVFEFILENRPKFTAKLKSLISARVKDEMFLDLLFSGISTKTIMSNYEINPPEEGYSPLSAKTGITPLLMNIYFDPLDQWIERKRKEVNRGKFRRVNPERAALILRGLDHKVPTEMLPLDPHDPIYRRLCYCRFADDFLLGLSGPRELALELQQEFWEFAASAVQFPLPSCKINHVQFKTRFLGHVLRRKVIMPRKAFIEVKKTRSGDRISREKDAEEVKVGESFYQVPEEKEDPELAALDGSFTPLKAQSIMDGPKEILSIDGEMDKIVRLLARAGYCHKNGDPQPNFRHLHFAQSETNQVIRRMLLSICDYYRMARNRQRLVHYCSYILRHSIAKMYAAKFKLRSRAKVFKRGGANLGARIKYGKGYIGKIDPDTGKGIEEYAELPYARISEIPRPDLTPLPVDWKPEIVHILNEKLIGNVPRF